MPAMEWILFHVALSKHLGCDMAHHPHPDLGNVICDGQRPEGVGPPSPGRGSLTRRIHLLIKPVCRRKLSSLKPLPGLLASWPPDLGA